MTNARQVRDRHHDTLSAEQALAIAQADASRAYRDLSTYHIRLALEDDGWHVDYEVRDPRFKGDGPSYVIDAVAGRIIFKRNGQ